jgi:hypothetical protein
MGGQIPISNEVGMSFSQLALTDIHTLDIRNHFDRCGRTPREDLVKLDDFPGLPMFASIGFNTRKTLFG